MLQELCVLSFSLSLSLSLSLSVSLSLSLSLSLSHGHRHSQALGPRPGYGRSFVSVPATRVHIRTDFDVGVLALRLDERLH
jgi:hypothetical protein